MNGVFGNRFLRAWLVAATVLAAFSMLPARAGTFEEVREFGSNPGNLRMFTYLPDGLPNGAPLVVVLHGCKQTARDYGEGAGWMELADRLGLALLLPEQKGPAGGAAGGFSLAALDSNNALGCFNWFEPQDRTRDEGEALSIRQMMAHMEADHQVDPARRYVTGLSAGGAMAAVMLAVYPELFAGGAVVAGLPYGCAARAWEAWTCMMLGRDLSPQDWAETVRTASDFDGPWPRVAIWHGSSDTTVHSFNAAELVEQWTAVHGIDQRVDSEDDLNGYPRQVYQDEDGRARVELVTVTGMGHAVPVDPGPGPDQCGRTGAYISDADVCASMHIARFWNLL